jgi:hypothetical protein
VILLNFDGSRYSVGDFRNFRWSPDHCSGA